MLKIIGFVQYADDCLNSWLCILSYIEMWIVSLLPEHHAVHLSLEFVTWYIWNETWY